jgi:DNA polymerase-3 subunit delta'
MDLNELLTDEKSAKSVTAVTASGRLPHAVILEGGGDDALKTAVYLSAYAVCSEADKPCGRCKNCQNALNKTHADITYVHPEGSRKSKTLSIDQIRELSKDAYILPNDSDSKVYIFENADSVFSEVAQNSFLKLLEEPPAGVYFILLCKSAKGLLPTIISRCALINIGSEAEITQEAKEAAVKIAEGILSLREYDLLLALRSLGDKQAADDILTYTKLILFDAVSLLSGAKPRYDPGLAKKLSAQFTRKKLLDMMELTDSSKYKIKQNININLLTTMMCGEYRRISWQR